MSARKVSAPGPSLLAYSRLKDVDWTTFGDGELPVWNASRQKWEGKPGRLNIYFWEHAAVFDASSPLGVVVASGSFVAESDTVNIDVAVSHAMLEYLGAWAQWTLYIGPSASPLSLKHQLDALGTGVSRYKINPISGLNGGGGLCRVLTGLTVGTRYYWEITAGIVGGAYVLNPVAFTPAPTTIAFSKQVTKKPEGAAWGGMSFNDGTFAVIKALHDTQFIDSIVTTFTAVQMAQSNGNHAGWVAVTPDGTRIIRTHQGDGKVAIITTGAGTNGVTPPAVQATPACAASPTGCACAPDNLTAWLTGAAANGTIQKIDLVAGTVATAIILSGVAAVVWDISVSTDNLNLYTISGGATPAVQKVRISDSAVLNNVALSNPSASGQMWCALAPAGDYLYIVASTAKRIWKIRTSDMVEVATAALSRIPTGVHVFPGDAQSLIVGSGETGAGAVQVLHLRVDDLSEWITWGNKLNGNLTSQTGDDNGASDIAIGPNGAIYVPNNTKKFLNIWNGGMIILHTTGSDANFYGDSLTMRVEGAHA